jgi:hypothetical protein
LAIRKIKEVQLNFPEFSFQIKTQNNQNYIFDVIRNKYVVLTPEEWVRQHVVHQLITNNFPKGRISVEKSLPNSTKRYDALYFDEKLSPYLLVECKAPSVSISQSVLNQVMRYISLLDIPHVLLSNGLSHFWFSRKGTSIEIKQEIPLFSAISG